MNFGPFIQKSACTKENSRGATQSCARQFACEVLRFGKFPFMFSCRRARQEQFTDNPFHGNSRSAL
jgi:hypothetical protein